MVRWVKENEEARRLTTIPGVGAIVASALVAAVGRAESFDRGRDLAAWLGLVPRQFTTGGKPKLLGISKRGNKYLRRQLIHGARAALPYVAERDTPRIATSGALMMGVKAVPPMPPRLEIVKQPPCMSSGGSFPARAFSDSCPKLRARP